MYHLSCASLMQLGTVQTVMRVSCWSGRCTLSSEIDVCFTFAATEPTEFAVLKQLLHWHHRGAVNLQLHTTKVHGAPMMLQQSVRGDQSSSSLPTVVPGRINKQHLQAVLQQLRADYGHADVLAYVCGPPQMTDEVTTMLVDLGVQPQDVHSERWW